MSPALNAGVFEKVISIEISEHYYNHCKKKFSANKKVSLFLGDSVDVLPRILEEINHSCTFWIDAHPHGKHKVEGKVKIPILKELEAIGNHHIKTHTILIDDMRLIDEYNLSLYAIEQAVYRINPDYKITYGFGVAENDILVAKI